jgi:chorismate mutase
MKITSLDTPRGPFVRFSIALMMGLALNCAVAVAAPPEAFVPVVRSMSDRLNTAEQVALSKWDSGKSVQDVARESQVIARAASMAPSLGLTAEDATALFTDQIEANKEVQYALLNTWLRSDRAPSTARKSLSGDIRPILDDLQASIMTNLHSVAALRTEASCQKQLAIAVGTVANQRSLDMLHLVALDRAVAHVCLTLK